MPDDPSPIVRRRGAPDAIRGILDQKLGQAEVEKATVFATFSVGLVLAGVVGWALGGLDTLVARASSGLPIALTLLLLFVATLNLLVRWSAKRSIARAEPVSLLLTTASVTVENLVPAIALVAASAFVPAEDTYEAPFLLLYGCSIALSALRLEPRLCLLAGLVAAGGYLGVERYLDLDLAGLSGEAITHRLRALLLVATGGVSAMVARSLRRSFEQSMAAAEDRNWLVGVFGRYVTDEVVDHLLNSPDGLRLGGEKRTVTVLMTDLRGFSKMSAQLPAEKVVSLLNHYLGSMTRVIQSHGGTIDEFIGDAILVIFNAPIEQPDHAERALRCAIAMQLEMDVVNEWNHAHQLTAIEMGIGVHTGVVVAGNIGSELRQKYGVVSVPVNLTARIEGYTVGGQILASGTTADLVPGLLTRGEREVLPKGEDAPVRIVDVLGIDALRLPDEQERLVDITPLAVHLWVLQGKDLSGPGHPGRLVALSDSCFGASVRPSRSAPR